MHPQCISRQSGFSMVELMVALVLGVILTSGVISVFISSKNTYNTNNSLGEVEDGGRYALGFMAPVVTLAGNTGCSRPTTLNNELNSSYLTGTTGNAPLYDFGTAVYGYEATGTGINATIPSNGGETVSSGTESYPTPDTSAGDWTPALTNNDPKKVLSNALNISGVGGVLKYSDVLVVHEALSSTNAGSGTATGSVSVAGIGSDAASVYVTPSSVTSTPYTAATFTQNEFAIATGCNSSGIGYAFQITSVNTSAGTLGYAGSAAANTPGNISAWTPQPITGSNVLPTTDSVQPATAYVFYVGQGADKWPALWEGFLSTTGSTAGTLVTQQLVSGVENMQVLYGVDSDGVDKIPNYFATADVVDAASNWSKVVAVRVALIMQSDNNAVDKAPTSSTNVYMLGSGRGYADNTILALPTDRRLRRVFVQTFSFRNLLP